MKAARTFAILAGVLGLLSCTGNAQNVVNTVLTAGPWFHGSWTCDVDDGDPSEPNKSFEATIDDGSWSIEIPDDVDEEWLSFMPHNGTWELTTSGLSVAFEGDATVGGTAVKITTDPETDSVVNSPIEFVSEYGPDGQYEPFVRGRVVGGPDDPALVLNYWVHNNAPTDGPTNEFGATFICQQA